MFRCSVCNRWILFPSIVGKHRLCKRCCKWFEPIIDAKIEFKNLFNSIPLNYKGV